MSKKIKQRKDIATNCKWDIESMYENSGQWQEDINLSLALADDFGSFSGKLDESSSNLLSALKLQEKLFQIIEKAFVFARMKRDEDNRLEEAQAMCDEAQTALSQISAKASFFTPELLSIDEDKLISWLEKSQELRKYDFLIKDALREKGHVLTKERETLLADISQLTSATNDIYNMLNNADMKFGEITDKTGKSVELTHGNYINFLSDYNRKVRQSAYETMYDTYKSMINTIATTYNYNTKTDAVMSKIRGYSSSRSRALSSDNIPEEVYDNLISVVRNNLHLHYRYMNLRRKILKLNNIKMYDIYVPLVKMPEKKYSFKEAVEIMRHALMPLGKKYINDMNEGLNSNWIDIYENEGKTSGAYSFGSYDSKPFILLNYNGSFKDIFTLVHEMGHSMHSLYTRRHQPYIYGDHSIFTAEVASTVNENLLIKYLLSEESDKTAQIYLINNYLDEFRTTVFRQTMFAEFEDFTHKAVEEGKPLTSNLLCNKYSELNGEYFGDSVTQDEWIRYEWARIPHFYNAFYVYQYATGFSAAAAISESILKNGAENYLDFLKTGSSNYPIELLKIAGVNMYETKPIEDAMSLFETLLTKMEEFF